LDETVKPGRKISPRCTACEILRIAFAAGYWYDFRVDCASKEAELTREKR